ncbi:unnamed protein product [Macrosiphum euphorbiae]|uniref:Uncharacterized protein n=1 Tax=Macrosiphum euphorbiae TaxID=13131 RepID=A0AAV0VSV9_9HEMI|nr:unnamed protein product [Macrosiphum euphorbiae]
MGDRQIKLPSEWNRVRVRLCAHAIAGAERGRFARHALCGGGFVVRWERRERVVAANKRGGQKAARPARGKQTCRKHLFLPVHRPYII